MAGDWAGMFNQINQAIGQSPVGGDMTQGLMGQLSQQAGGALGAATGADPMGFMSQAGKQIEGRNQMAGLDMTTAAGMGSAADLYGRMGDTEKQFAMAQAAQKQKLFEEQKKKEQLLRESLVKRANALGYTGLAEGIATGATDLATAATEVREAEKTDLLTKRGLPARRALAKNAGISMEEFEAANMGTITDDEFKAIIEGQEGDTKSYLGPDGKPVSLRTTKFGRVWDKESESFKNPSEMGLTPAPQLQRVENVSNAMVEKLALQGVENFGDLYEAANDAQGQLDNINRSLPLIDKMNTGTLAEVRLIVDRALDTFGIPRPTATNSEVYLADAGKRVAEEIKAFGAGTGLSDKDREFAEGIAAGKISTTPEALKRILKIRAAAAQGTIDQFYRVKDETAKRLGSNASVLDLYTLKHPQAAPVEENVRVWDPATGTWVN